MLGAGRARERVLRETAERRVRNCMVVVVSWWLVALVERSKGWFGLLEIALMFLLVVDGLLPLHGARASVI